MKSLQQKYPNFNNENRILISDRRRLTNDCKTSLVVNMRDAYHKKKNHLKKFDSTMFEWIGWYIGGIGNDRTIHQYIVIVIFRVHHDNTERTNNVIHII